MQTRIGQKRDPMKINFGNFKCKNEFPKQLRLEKQMEKMGHLSDASKTSKAIIAIYVYASGKILFLFFRKWYWIFYAMT